MHAKSIAVFALAVVAAARPHSRRALSTQNTGLTLEEKERVLLDSFSSVTLEQWSYYYASGAHLAGKNLSQAEWTRDRWIENGIPTRIDSYDVFLNYPVSKSLTLTYPNGSTYVPSLEEDVVAEDWTTGLPNRIPTFHGYSFSGSASAEYVYVGRGRQTDFERLKQLGVKLEGKIALAKYGGPFRGLKVKNAQENGMIAAVLFTDPGDDGNITEANGYKPYPEGPARNPSSVQRGSVMFLSTYPGDPTTPGYPSIRGAPRADISPVTPRIPSLPISFKEVLPLLTALNGHGFSAAEVNATNWVGGLGYLGVEYSTGPVDGLKLDLNNLMKDEITPIWNTIGIINGTIEDEVIVIGNHRDAWLIGGAADPNSGSAVLIELSKALRALQEHGWKPLRTIILASWDAEEYGLVGSTEWFEEFVQWAVPNVVAYLNIDVAVNGPNLGLTGVPELHDIVLELLKKVESPSSLTKGTNATLYDDWVGSRQQIGVLGSGSDYTPFVHSGIAAFDMGFNQGQFDPVYHYHSNYDTHHWMTTYGDPDYLYHKAIGQFLGLLTIHLSDSPLLPLNATDYAAALEQYLTTLEGVVKSAQGSGKAKLDLNPLKKEIKEFRKNAEKLMKLKAVAVQKELIQIVNHKLKNFERGFTSQGGLPGREFYKHVVYAPGIDTGYAPVTFPGITEAVQAGKWELATEWVKKTARGIKVASDILRI